MEITGDGESDSHVAFRGNYFQGVFPGTDTGEDGYVTVSPVDAFPPQNGYGVRDMVGNVWEWTNTLWSPGIPTPRPSTGEQVAYVKKGGSYICHEEYCYGYRNAARSGNSGDSTAGNLGFRCVRGLVEEGGG